MIALISVNRMSLFRRILYIKILVRFSPPTESYHINHLAPSIRNRPISLSFLPVSDLLLAEISVTVFSHIWMQHLVLDAPQYLIFYLTPFFKWSMTIVYVCICDDDQVQVLEANEYQTLKAR